MLIWACPAVTTVERFLPSPTIANVEPNFWVLVPDAASLKVIGWFTAVSRTPKAAPTLFEVVFVPAFGLFVNE